MSNLSALLEFLGLHKVNRELKMNLDIGLQDGFLPWRFSGLFLSLTNLLANLFHTEIISPANSDAKTFSKSQKRYKIRLFLHTCAGPNSAEIENIFKCFSILFPFISIVLFSTLWEELELLKYQGTGILQIFSSSKMIPPFIWHLNCPTFSYDVKNMLTIMKSA